MKSPFKHYGGLFGDDQFSANAPNIHLEPLQLRSSVFAYEIDEHVHTNLTQVFFIELGTGTLDSEGQKLRFEAPCIVFIPSGVLHGFSFSTDISGEVLTLDADLFEQCLQGLPHIGLHFQDLKLLPFYEKLASFQELMGTRQRFHTELNQERLARDKIIELLLQILIVRLYRLVLDHEALSLTGENRYLGYYRQFLEFVRKKGSNELTVVSCAQHLRISTGHLNRICKSVVNRTAQQILHEQLALKAKRLLLISDKSITEIAYQLNFKDPSHFSKFFRQQEGISPRAFKRAKTV